MKCAFKWELADQSEFGSSEDYSDAESEMKGLLRRAVNKARHPFNISFALEIGVLALSLVMSRGIVDGDRDNWAREIIAATPFHPSAELEGETLSKMPENWVAEKVSDAEISRIVGPKLQNANLRFANFVEAIAIRANFASADLTGADFKSADLRGANFTDAVLRGADLRGANLNYVIGLEPDQLKRAKFDSKTIFPEYLLQDSAFQILLGSRRSGW